jgi:hypothetical protein
VARSFRCLVLTSGCFLGACGPSDAIIDVENEPAPLWQGTVDDAVANSCSTGAVLGLSNQVVEQVNCLRPNTLVEVPARPNLTRGGNTFAFMQPAARDALVRALDANTSMTLGVNSMLRTVVQQFLLYSWYMAGRCSIALAAAPGGSNHESGLALDTSQYAAWQASLEAEGFTWLGSSDPVHFDYARAGTIDLRPIGVRGFQKLWNVNHAADAIAEDGIYGPATESRLRQSPAAGFSTQAPCSGSDGGAADVQDRDVADAGSSPPDGGRADGVGIDVIADAGSDVAADRADAGAARETGGGTGGSGSTDGAPAVDAITPPDDAPDPAPDGASNDVSSMPPGALEPGCSCRVNARARSLPTPWWAVGAAASFYFIRRRAKAHREMARKASPWARALPAGRERS